MRIENEISNSISDAFKDIYRSEIDETKIQIQKTRKEFEGDFTVVVFSLLPYSKKSPEETANSLGTFLQRNLDSIADYNVVKGFLNLTVSNKYWLDFFNGIFNDKAYGFTVVDDNSSKIVIEYSSPNTNKPLHLGHVRNNLLGWALAKILQANGNKVLKVNLVNDRGIHICKSMLAWQEFSNDEKPETIGMKGDHFVGKYYVLFNEEYNKQVDKLINEGHSEKDAKEQAPWLIKARSMLKKWERGSRKIRELWSEMNSWVYEGFEKTYKDLGISFDKTYFESETYLIGKDIVMNALRIGELHQKTSGAVVMDLAEYGMDEKILLRSDGTTVYMTQDIGTAVARYDDYQFDESIYVVGNEQDYHFKVLSIVLDRLEYPWSNRLTHLSYGMVELPEGKMKSREGTVVDADVLIDEMIKTAKETSEKLGKLRGLSDTEKDEIYRKTALGALKFFILKVDSKKNMTFNPEESIDFTGNTGPFVQYSYVRVKSLLNKANEEKIYIGKSFKSDEITPKENDLLKLIYDYPAVIKEAGVKRNPSFIANYVYEVSKEYNQYYHEVGILNEENTDIREFRLALSSKIGEIIKSSLDLLGIEVPERM